MTIVHGIVCITRPLRSPFVNQEKVRTNVYKQHFSMLPPQRNKLSYRNSVWRRQMMWAQGCHFHKTGEGLDWIEKLQSEHSHM